MEEYDLPRKTGDGLYSIMLRPCTAEILLHLLDPDVAFVWVIAHHPNRVLEWWACDVPFSKQGRTHSVEVRQLSYDLLMPTHELLARVSEFDGIALHQMRHRVPSTLVSERLDDENRVRILVQNGLVATFYLPHAMECASFATVERATIEKALGNEAVRELAY